MRISCIKRCMIFLSLFTIVAAVFVGTVVTADEGDTFVSINPQGQSVDAGESFNVNVSCIPGQAVKAFEFRISFDSSLLQANSVSEGDIFNGYNTFFNPGNIDNVAGSINAIYGLIIGQGNVSNSGSFVTISFTALQNSGTSDLVLHGVGVTDELGYLSVNVSGSSVSIIGSGGGDPPGGGDYLPPPQGDVDENKAPDTPVKPSGPTFVEMGVVYSFESSTVDVDDDRIRYRFDWGDGNISNWSEYVISNVTVSMSHSWTYASSFDVMVIAQDENGLNSSWSLPLNVTVSQNSFKGSPPVAVIDASGNISSNETIVFDASSSFDVDGVIVFYFWDFGDGEVGSGLRTSHTYKSPGKYQVTLIVTDNDNNSYSTSLIVNVASDVNDSEEDYGVLSFSISVVIIGISIAFVICLTIFFRQNIKLFFSTHLFPFFSDTKVFRSKTKIKKIDTKIQEIKKSFK